MQSKIQNTGKTPVKKINKENSIVFFTVHYAVLQILF